MNLSIVTLLFGLSLSVVGDLRDGLIRNYITYPLLCLLLIMAFLRGELLSAVVGGVTCAAIIGILYVLTAGRGIGLGDLKLAACIGAALGLLAGAIAIGAAFVIGGIFGALLLALQQAGPKTHIRFAPFLALGTVVSLVYGAIIR